MKLLRYLLVWVALALCSCSLFVAGTSEEENTVANLPCVDVGVDSLSSSSQAAQKVEWSTTSGIGDKGDVDVTPVTPSSSNSAVESSSAAVVNPPMSNTSGNADVLSSTSVSPKSSETNSSSPSEDGPSGDGDSKGGNAGWGCGVNAAGLGFGGTTSGNDDSLEIYDAIYDSPVNARVAKLVADGKNEDEAQTLALSEIYKVFGINDVEAVSKMTMHSYTVKRTVGYLLVGMGAARSAFEATFVASGDADESELCWIYEGSFYSRLGLAVSRIAPSGCVIDEIFVSEPGLILEGIWRRCGNLPACTEDMQDSMVQIEATASKPVETLVCKNSSWKKASLMDLETASHPCTKNGERLASDSLSYVTYVCHEGEWYTSEDGTEILPVEYFLNPDIDYGTFTDPRDGQVYKTTQFNGKTWLAQNINYYDKDDTLFVNSSMCLSDADKGSGDKGWTCEKNGRYYRENAAHKACPEGWRLPSKADWNDVKNMDYTESTQYMPKLFSKISSVRNASDEFGLSLREQTLIDAYGWYQAGVNYAYFWLEESVFAAVSSTRIEFWEKDTREYGQFVPVRCVKD